MIQHAAIGFVLVAFGAGLSAQDAWVSLDSREAKDAQLPTLELKTATGFAVSLEPAADAALLQYLGRGNYGKLRSNPVGVGDKNRSLIRFALPSGLTKRGKLTTAELVLPWQPGKRAPVGRFEVGVHRVTAAWQELRVTWDKQPEFAENPAAVVVAGKNAMTTRTDVTQLVVEWVKAPEQNHGILLKQYGVDSGADLPRQLYALLPWHDRAAAAVAAARRQKRPVLTLIRPAYSPTSKDEIEPLLLATVFADPLVRRLVETRFVPLRLGYRPSYYTHGRAPRGGDPLRAIGGDCTIIKAPALCVTDQAGKLVTYLDSIGTYDVALVDRFLRQALARVPSPALPDAARKDAARMWDEGRLDFAAKAFAALPEPQHEYGRCRLAARRGVHQEAIRLAARIAAGSSVLAPDAHVQLGVSSMRLGKFDAALDALTMSVRRQPAGKRLAEALYWRACLLRARGDETTATDVFKALRKQHPKSPFALRAAVRLAWPERIDPVESLRAVPLPKTLPTRTERAVLAAEVDGFVDRSLDYLLGQQRTDGSFPCPIAMYKDAVVALAGRAFEAHIASSEGARRAQLIAASDKAAAWVHRYVATINPEAANSFGAAYIIDYLVARDARLRAKQDPIDANVQAAVALLEKGQCPGGAWSYSYEFGTTWRGGFGGWPRTTKGRVHSVNTGPALVFLVAARDRGYKVDADRLERGAAALLEMRDGPGVYTYTFPEPKNFRRKDQSIARGPVCEQALFALGEVEREDLQSSLAIFAEHRAGLRLPAKLDKAWASPSNYSSYFYFYAHYHAVLAARALGPKGAVLLAKVRAEILSVPELDATWLDFPEVGKPYGTAVALTILGLTQEK